MNYLNKLTSITNREHLLVREINENHIQIFSLLDNKMINPENYYEMEYCKEKFNIYRISRGQKAEIANFCEEKYAYLFMGLLANESIESIINPVPDAICNLFDEKEDSLGYLEKLISKYVKNTFFSIFEFKNNSICLIKEDNYIVYFVDWKGKKNVVSCDNDEFGIGLQVLCNYAWTFQWIWKQINGWNVDLDNKEFIYVIKKVLNI